MRNHIYSDLASAFTRRNFLKAASILTAGAAIGAPSMLCAAKSKPKPKPKLKPVPATAPAKPRIRLGIVGCGGQGRADMGNLIGAGAIMTAFCDVDQQMLAKARTMAGEASKQGKSYDDYRKMLDHAKDFDAVLIATPDHWHAPICKEFMKAGKHIFCEKPLTHTIAEARELRELARTCNIVTQMGNQGSANNSMRRSVEIIKAGALGQIKDIYIWGPAGVAKNGHPDGEDVLPAGLNWDFWCGPSPLRPWKKEIYHPFRWRSWYDFGNGSVADFCCHGINTAHRALDLIYPERIVIDPKSASLVDFCFPARGNLAPLTIHWLRGKPSDKIAADLRTVYKKELPGNGVFTVGEKGTINTDVWCKNAVLKLQGEARLYDITRHAATKDIATTLPRCKSHYDEFVSACVGEGKTYSPFEIGGMLTEIGLAGVVALRVGKTIQWDGEKMKAKNAPEADKFVHIDSRTKWLV